MRNPLRYLGLIAAGMAVWAFLGTAAVAQEPCTPMKWDVAHERALFATAPRSVAAGKEAATAATLLPDTLYELALLPQEQVALPVPPGARARTQGAFAGLARLHLVAPGT